MSSAGFSNAVAAGANLTDQWPHALTFEERLALVRDTPHARTHYDVNLAEEQLADWQTQTSISDPTEMILALYGLKCSRDEVRYVLGTDPKRLTHLYPPEWVTLLTAVYAGSVAQNQKTGVSGLLQPLVDHYQDSLRAQLQTRPGVNTIITDSGSFASNAADWLTLRLTAQSEKAFALQSLIHELEHEGSNARERGVWVTEPAKRQAFFATYPVLARNLVQICAQWQENMLEFVDRLIADSEAIKTTFSLSHDDRLATFAPGAGDTHNHGRSVFVLCFSSKTHLVYKPRCIKPEAHFQELLTWINGKRQSPTLKRLRMISGPDYGWVEFVPHTLCDTPDELRSFYQREGALLAITHALSMTDVHFENIIACRDQPIVIDLETLLHPNFRSEPLNTHDACFASVRRSVMATAMLPEPDLTADGDVFDSSGITATTRSLSLPADKSPLPNRPADSDKFLIDEIIGGFEATYDILSQHSAELLAAKGPLSRFADSVTRLIVRPTALYSSLLNDATHPDVLQDALDRERFYAKLIPTSKYWPFVNKFIPSEVRQLRCNDIPCFALSPLKVSAFGPDGSFIPKVTDSPMLQTVADRIRAFSKGDRQRQTWFIRASLGDDKPYHVPTDDIFHAGVEPIDVATEIGHQLVDRLITVQDTARFFHVQPLTEQPDYPLPHYSIRPAGNGLYDGLAGAAIYLAYLGREIDNSDFSAAARTLVASIEADFHSAADQPISAFTGTGSLIYLFTHLAELWDDANSVSNIATLLPLVEAGIEHDSQFDIMSGSAGLALVLAGNARNAIALESANHLLKTNQSGRPNWISTPFQRGFSHGASGVALALAHTFRTTSEKRFSTAAFAAIDHERRLIANGNWTDRHYSANGHQCSWCHGAAGIALSRLATSESLETATLNVDIEVALDATARGYWQTSFCLCHGVLGNLEPFIQATRNSRFTASAHTFLRDAKQRVLEHFASEGWRSAHPSQTHGSGLMTGLAGIGYGLLRLARPDTVPSVLILEKSIR